MANMQTYWKPFVLKDLPDTDALDAAITEFSEMFAAANNSGDSAKEALEKSITHKRGERHWVLH